MTMLKISVVASDGQLRHEAAGTDEVTLSWRGAYAPGDRLVVTAGEDPVRLVLKLDECLAESHVLLFGGRFEFPIPVDAPEQVAYGKGRAFTGERHWAFVRVEDEREHGAWRNLALNAHDLKLGEGEALAAGHDPESLARPVLFPHASTNVVCDNPQFYARNAIDGVFEASKHGSWPHESWGVAGNPEAWLRVDFGEPVMADELRLYLRADFPHDTCWEHARLELSSGEDLALELAKTGARQTFDLGGRTLSWVRLHGLEKRDEEGFPGLSQLEVWGRPVA